ncbi:hypothetical protein ACG74X_09415 [Marivita sp. S0852]|uniref:hypothetical protein n=1 Tax=Marivita sp. S0852 TaxID=3373893 RepID=UPI0039826B1F
MTDGINKLAWFVAALTILAWAFVPRIVAAHPVYFPKVPVIKTTVLPPADMDPQNDSTPTVDGSG